MSPLMEIVYGYSCFFAGFVIGGYLSAKVVIRLASKRAHPSPSSPRGTDKEVL